MRTTSRTAIVLVTLLLLGSILACNVVDVDVNVPTLEVEDMRDERREIPLGDAESAAIEVAFGAGSLDLEAGVSGELVSGRFRYNVERWAPEMTYEDGRATVRQGGSEESWGIPTGKFHNEWELEFSPEIPLDVEAKLGAGSGELDFTGLQLTALDVDIGAGDFSLRFDEPNRASMERLTLDTGASRLEALHIGNASPEQMKLRGGLGDIKLDLTGDWKRSAEVDVKAGAGSVNLRLPDDVGVRIEMKGGLSNVEAFGLKQMGDVYTNDVFGEAETELNINVTTGVGNVRLVEAGSED